MTPEGKVKSEVAKSLACLEQAGDVIWWERLNSGSIHKEGVHVNGCRPGTFDFISIFRNKQNNVSVAFVEVKRNDKKATLSDTQKVFKERYEGKHELVYFWLVQSGIEVERLILNHCYNRVEAMEFKL